MYLLRAFLVWLVIIGSETIHGTLRNLFLAPRVGDFHARQIGALTGSLLIFVIAFLFVRWIAAPSTKSLVIVGLFWMVLTLIFEIVLGRFVFGLSWERLISDYDVSRGGLMWFGLLFMAAAPLLAAKLRGMKTETSSG